MQERNIFGGDFDEPRAGIAWDLTGQGTTVLHASTGLFHNARLGGGNLGNLSGNPPFIHNPIYFYGTTAGLLAGGTTVANRPATIEALDWDYKTPSAINWSLGIRRDIGWGTVVDAAYVGNVGSGEVKDFTAVGDVVNTAARLQSSADAGQIVLSERLCARLSEVPAAAQRTTIELKGKREPEAVRVLDVTRA